MARGAVLALAVVGYDHLAGKALRMSRIAWTRALPDRNWCRPLVPLAVDLDYDHVAPWR